MDELLRDLQEKHDKTTGLMQNIQQGLQKIQEEEANIESRKSELRANFIFLQGKLNSYKELLESLNKPSVSTTEEKSNEGIPALKIVSNNE